MITNAPITTSKKVEVTITLPSINVASLLKKVKSSLGVFISGIYSPINNGISNAGHATSSRAKRMKFPQFKNIGSKFNKKNLRIILPVIIGVIVIAAIINIAKSLPDAKSNPSSSVNTATSETLATLPLERKFVFPLNDEKGKEVGNFDYVIQEASLQKQIIVQGQRASAVNGRVFLILNLKIINNLETTIQLNTRDYLRLVVLSNTNEQLAPDIHNDPVEVQAISTKYTRVGIAIDEADARKKIQLKVGEINGEKQTIDLNFKY